MKYNYDEAIVHFRKALAIDPENYNLHDNLGVALVRTGNFKEALTYFQESLRLNPKGAYAGDNIRKVSAALEKEKAENSSAQ